MQYSEFQNQPSSEKLTLAILSASKRLMGWSLHSGSVYKLEAFPYAVIQTIEDSGTAYTAAADVGSVAASKYYLDRDTQTLYIRTTGSDNPNGRFIVATVNLHFASAPIALPHDLASGFEVFYEPLVKSTSEFGVNIDTIKQTSEAIEGSGSLTLHNDFDFWPANYDKLSFDNQRCLLYSFNRDLNVNQARLIFKGKVETQSYGKDTVSFQLKDQFAELRAPLPLSDISELGERTGDDISEAKQRQIYGRVYGIVPTNLDQILDGYPITGTISINFGDDTVTGSDTTFLAELSPDDRLVLNGEEYTIATVPSNTSLTLTEEYTGDVNLSGASITVIPDQPKRYINRRFMVAGHALREPVTQTEAGSTIDTLFITDTSEIFADDNIYIGPLGSGELAVVHSVSGRHVVKLSTSLANVPAVGTQVLKPAVQNVRIDDVMLSYYRDYTFDADTGILTLNDDAEANAAPIRHLASDAAFTSGSRTVSGSGFNNVIFPGYMVSQVGQVGFFEVLSVDSDTQLTLRTTSTFTGTSTLRYKSLIYNHDETVLSLDCLGRTDDGTSDGNLLKTAPAITKQLLMDAGLGTDINEDSFDLAEEIAYQEIGIIIPATYSEKTTLTYRDVLNKVNKSVFGTLVQDGDFNFSYLVLQPRKPTSSSKFTESDLLSFSLSTTAENVVKTVRVEYNQKEYDYLTKKSGISTSQKTSDNATYVVKTDRERVITTYLVDETDAQICAARWAFLLQCSTGRLSFTIKLQGIDLEIGDIVEIEHRKFFERYGSTGKRKLLLVESVQRSGSLVKVEATDLSNTFNRIACINSSSNAWGDATETERLYGGYYTDDYGLIDNDPDSFGTNLIW